DPRRRGHAPADRPALAHGGDRRLQPLRRGLPRHLRPALRDQRRAVPRAGGAAQGEVSRSARRPGPRLAGRGQARTPLRRQRRGGYDSDAAACLTLAELERWLTLAIVGRYHNEVHDGIGEPPLARWRRGVGESGAPPAIADPGAFLIDFLPVLRRRVTREGIRV